MTNSHQTTCNILKKFVASFWTDSSPLKYPRQTFCAHDTSNLQGNKQLFSRYFLFLSRMNILLSSLVERTSLHHDTLIQPFLYCCIRAKGWRVAVVADKNNGTACSHLITLIVLTFSVSDYVLEFRVWAKWALECSKTLDWIAINQRKSGWVLKRHQLLARIKKQQQCGFTCWTGECAHICFPILCTKS